MKNKRFTADEWTVIEQASVILRSGLKKGLAVSEPGVAGTYFQTQLRHLEHEVFSVMFLDHQHRMLAFENMFRGTIDGSEVHPREVAKRALELNAAAIIVGHNHPSGNPEASAADRVVTQRLKQSLALLDIRVLDHFIIADGAPVSMASKGWV